MIEITNQNFQTEVLDFPGKVLADFWAPWCGPCQMLGPSIEEISNEMENIKVGKVNVDEEGSLAQHFQIMSIPAVFIFKDGEVVETMIGAQSKDSYIATIKKYL